MTREIIRVPANGAAFRWRLSIAQLDASGPFSNFAGYTRTMVLLRGSGVELAIAGARPTRLRNVGDLVVFDGARPTQCTLLGSACSDLNLMVAHSVRDVRSWIDRLMEPRRLAAATTTTLVFAVAGALYFVAGEPAAGEPAAGVPAEGTALGARIRLDEWDLAVISPGESVFVTPAAVGAGARAAAPLVFFATLDDNSP